MTFERIGMNHKELLCPTVNSYSFQLQSAFSSLGRVIGSVDFGRSCSVTFERIGMNHKELLCPTVNSYSFQLQSRKVL